MFKRFGTPLKLLLALLSALSQVLELIPFFSKWPMKLDLFVHSGDRWFSYVWRDSDHIEVGHLAYDVTAGVFTCQEFPACFDLADKVRAYMSVLHSVLRLIKLKKRYYEKS